MNKQQLIDELARLYRLQNECKEVSKLIAELEAMLCDKMGCDDEGDDDG